MMLQKIQEEYQQPIEEHEQAVALLKYNLRHCAIQTQAIKYKNVELQGEINAKDMQIEQCENTINHLREIMLPM